MVSAERLAEISGLEASDLLAGYRPLPGVIDELVDGQGRVRPHWRAVLEALAGLDPAERQARFDMAERQLKTSGASYHVYDDNRGRDRPWPLSPIPLVIAPGEWAEIAAGVAQR